MKKILGISATQAVNRRSTSEYLLDVALKEAAKNLEGVPEEVIIDGDKQRGFISVEDPYKLEGKGRDTGKVNVSLHNITFANGTGLDAVNGVINFREAKTLFLDKTYKSFISIIADNKLCLDCEKFSKSASIINSSFENFTP